MPGPSHQLLRGPLPRPSRHLLTCSTHSTSELFKIQIESHGLCWKVSAGFLVLLGQRMVPCHTCNGPCEVWPLSLLPIPPQSLPPLLCLLCFSHTSFFLLPRLPTSPPAPGPLHMQSRYALPVTHLRHTLLRSLPALSDLSSPSLPSPLVPGGSSPSWG